MPTALRTAPLRGVPASVTPRWKRIGHLGRQRPVGLHHRRHVEGLERDLDQVEAHLFQDADLPQRGLDHALCGGGRRLRPRRAMAAAAGCPRSRRRGSASRRSFASRTTSRIFSGSRMLPGLRRRPWTPARRAASARRWSKWMSATDGTGAVRDELRQGVGGAPVGHGHPHDLAAQLSERVDLAQRGGERRRSWCWSSTGRR